MKIKLPEIKILLPLIVLGGYAYANDNFPTTVRAVNQTNCIVTFDDQGKVISAKYDDTQAKAITFYYYLTPGDYQRDKTLQPTQADDVHLSVNGSSTEINVGYADFGTIQYTYSSLSSLFPYKTWYAYQYTDGGHYCPISTPQRLCLQADVVNYCAQSTDLGSSPNAVAINQ